MCSMVLRLPTLVTSSPRVPVQICKRWWQISCQVAQTFTDLKNSPEDLRMGRAVTVNYFLKTTFNLKYIFRYIFPWAFILLLCTLLFSFPFLATEPSGGQYITLVQTELSQQPWDIHGSQKTYPKDLSGPLTPPPHHEVEIWILSEMCWQLFDGLAWTLVQTFMFPSEWIVIIF